MDFFNKLGKKATKACKFTADKTEKFAKETKFKFRMGELKSKIEDIYEDIGKKVYEKHIKNEDIISDDILEECKKIDAMSTEIEQIRHECLGLKDKKQCPKCFKEIEKEMKFCPECGEKQHKEKPNEVELIEVKVGTMEEELTKKLKDLNKDKENVEKDEKKLNKDKENVGKDEKTLNKDKENLGKDENNLNKDRGNIEKDTKSLNKDEEKLSKDEKELSNDKENKKDKFENKKRDYKNVYREDNKQNEQTNLEKTTIVEINPDLQNNQ